MAPESRWLNPAEAATYLGVKPKRLRAYVKAGRIPAPHYDLGPKTPRWDRLALDAVFSRGQSPKAVTQRGFDEVIDDILSGRRTRRQNAPGRRNG